MTESAQNSNEKKIGIKEHIDSNVNLYTVFGIMNALSIYSSTLESFKFKSLLTFLFITLSLILWIKIRFQNFRHNAFELTVYLTLLDIVYCCLFLLWAQYTEHRNQFIFYFLVFAYLTLFGKNIAAWLNKFSFLRTEKSSNIFVLTFAICGLSAGLTGTLIATGIDYIFSKLSF
jgi:hypothetical protein